MFQRCAVALALAFAGVVGSSREAKAVPVAPSGAAVLAGTGVTTVDLGCGRGYTRGSFGACVKLHHRHDRMHGRHSGHDYDIHDQRHYRTEPHLYHSPSRHRGAHRR